MALGPTTLLSLPFLLFPLAASHDITRILTQFPDFSTFSNLLTQAQLVPEINRRQTITVLAVSNGAISSASSQPADTLKKILSLHIILDYYDGDKIHKLSKHSAILATLFQASGLASGQNGFLNVTDMDNGQVAFGSAVPGSSLNANFVKVLATRPYNISVLHISGVIVPPNISGGPSTNQSTGAPTAAPKASPAPPKAAPKAAASRRAMAPGAAPGPANAASKSARPLLALSGAAPSSGSDAASPSDAPEPADAPTSDAPATSSPAPAGPDGSPTGSLSDVADAPGGESSSADRLVIGAGVALAMGFAMLGSF